MSQPRRRFMGKDFDNILLDLEFFSREMENSLAPITNGILSLKDKIKYLENLIDSLSEGREKINSCEGGGGNID